MKYTSMAGPIAFQYFDSISRYKSIDFVNNRLIFFPKIMTNIKMH